MFADSCLLKFPCRLYYSRIALARTSLTQTPFQVEENGWWSLGKTRLTRRKTHAYLSRIFFREWNNYSSTYKCNYSFNSKVCVMDSTAFVFGKIKPYALKISTLISNAFQAIELRQSNTSFSDLSWYCCSDSFIMAAQRKLGCLTFED